MIAKNTVELRLQPETLDAMGGHKVKGSVLLPGAFIAAVSAQANIQLHGISFLRPVSLSGGENCVFARNTTGSGVAEFFEVNNDQRSGEPFASIEKQTKTSGENTLGHADVSQLNEHAQFISSDSLYSALHSAGNQYHGAFRSLVKISKQEGGTVGEWHCAPAAQSPTLALTTLLDACTHVASHEGDFKNVFMLHSIGKITFTNTVVPEDTMRLVAVSKEIQADGDSRRDFDCTILNKSGELFAKIEGIRLAYEGVESSGEEKSVAIAASFTIDPLLDAVEFWNGKTNLTLKTEIAEYGQVFQSLMGVNPIFSKKNDKNLSFLRIQDLLGSQGTLAGEMLNESKTEMLDDKHDLLELPDGRTVCSLNSYETKYLYREIFEDLSYYKNDICVRDDDVVIDVGANIGLFSLFVSGEADNVTVYSVEPSPAVFKILESNLRTYVPGAIAVNAGMSDSTGTANFTAYKNSSVFSSFDADDTGDENAIRAIVRNQIEESGVDNDDLLESAVDEFLEGRLEKETYVCDLISLSDLVRKHDIKKIDLLKIDAEKSETQIVDGIEDDHWPLIEQIILEIHTQSGTSTEPMIKLLEQKGFVVKSDEETLLQQSGLVNLYAIRPSRLELQQSEIEKGAHTELVSELDRAVESYTAMTESPLELIFCPPGKNSAISPGYYRKLEELAIKKLNCHSNVSSSLWSEYCASYPVNVIHDYLTDSLGHIPYSNDWFIASASAMYRSMVVSCLKPLKVIAVDCDNTLWDGVVGEVGTDGISITKHHQSFHRFLKRKVSEGYLLVLLSKNNEQEVWDVFENHPDILLTREDVIEWEINWEQKPENIQKIAQRLNVGLDSFIFFDDSPVECEQMKLSQPSVITIAVPENTKSFTRMLPHLWNLDVTAVSDVDSKRTELYRAEKDRNEIKSKSVSLDEFIEMLELSVTIKAVGPENLNRAAQMCSRTNQFNLTTKRYTESEIHSLVDNESILCEVISVKDKFGDYGVTGLLIYSEKESKIYVDTFLLSCRVLGRGVEKSVLEHLRTFATTSGASNIVFEYSKTERNEPAINFLESIKGRYEEYEKVSVKLCPIGDENMIVEAPAEVTSKDSLSAKIQSNAANMQSVNPLHNNETIELIATSYNSISAIRKQLSKRKQNPRPELSELFVEPKTALEIGLSKVWMKVLELERVGVNDNFFDLGGTSLKSVEMASQVKEELKIRISVADVFESSTISDLAKRLSRAAEGGSERMSDSKDRGADRRVNRLNRRRR